MMLLVFYSDVCLTLLLLHNSLGVSYRALVHPSPLWLTTWAPFDDTAIRRYVMLFSVMLAALMVSQLRSQRVTTRSQ